MKLEEDILKSLIQGSRYDSGKKNIYGTCPWCGGHEFGVSVKENHLFGCFRKSQCGVTGNIFKLLKKLGRQDLLKEEIIKLGEKLEFEIDKVKEEEVLELNTPTVKPPIGFRRISSNSYLESRGFTGFDKWQVGMTVLERRFKDRVIFLIREDGEVKGYLGRAIKDDMSPKYRNSENDFSKLLGGIDEIEEETHTLILVEGLLDKENTDKLLKLDNQSGVKCVCTFGAKISLIQIVKMKMFNIKKIILFYENDVIGVIQKHAFRLKQEFESVKIVLPPAGKDPGDITKKELTRCLEKEYSPMDFYRKKVNIIRLK